MALGHGVQFIAVFAASYLIALHFFIDLRWPENVYNAVGEGTAAFASRGDAN